MHLTLAPTLTKLAKLQDLVTHNINDAAQQQQTHYNKHSVTRTFSVGEPIWLSIPTARKLQPRWEGQWTVKQIIGPVNLKITDGKRTKVVHMIRVQPQKFKEGMPLKDRSFRSTLSNGIRETLSTAKQKTT